MPKLFPLKIRRFVLTLRTKLLFMALTLLAIPWIGYQYVKEMESYLRQSQEEALLAMARAAGTILNEHAELFIKQANVVQTAKSTHHTYVRPLKNPIILDGYDSDDWEPYVDWFQTYARENIIESHRPYTPQNLSFRHAIGSYHKHLYVFFKVTDDNVVYRDMNSFRLDRSDHLQIAMETPEGKFLRFSITTGAPGLVNAHPVSEDGALPSAEGPELRIKGMWTVTRDGYNIEIRIPLSMIGPKLAFAIADVDDPIAREVHTVIGTAGTRRIEELGTVMVPSAGLEKLLKGLERNAVRTWVIDPSYRVIAVAGDLKSQKPPASVDNPSFVAGLMRTLYEWILDPPTAEFQDLFSGVSVLRGVEIESALKGKPATYWRKTPDNRVSVLSAAYPVWSGEKIVGTVVMHQTSNSILLLQKRAIENLISTSLLVFAVAITVLLIFATRLSSRVRQLRDDTEKAIGLDGKVRGGITHLDNSDEIGDLSRSIAHMLERLGQYNRYLETMASKLSHELRTPLAVVKSSLDNLELQTLNPEAGTYTKRAREGLERLSNILTRMSEANRLEQSLQNSDREMFKVDHVFKGCIDGYKIAYPTRKFEVEIEDHDFSLWGVPDLIAQMLDKLVSNANDFATPNSPLRLGLHWHDHTLVITIANEGTLLPKEMHGNLFDSMVSIRSKRGESLHLGLGLYIVRIIVDFHNGMVDASNTKDPEGVIFTVVIPQDQTVNTP